ncbi:MFS transporter [Rhodobaculum claviforme]|uniref:MFS transporter n=1 Tax=Rhodobaculum claviforme TaxID=1549854 RepID=UPI001914938F
MGISGATPPAPRTGRTLAIVCAAHFISHLHIVALPPVFALMAVHYGVGFAELGLALAVFNLATLVTQPLAGLAADRIGPRPVLAAGLLLAGATYVAVGLSQGYGALLALMVVAGVANSVYHPADYAILGRTTGGGRKGRAFAWHTFAGFLGGAVAPLTMAAAVIAHSWQAGLIAVGGLALLVAPLVALIPPLPGGAAPPAQGSGRVTRALTGLTGGLAAGPLLRLTGFFFLMALATIGLQGFTVAALAEGRGMGVAEANLALSSFLLAMALGVLAGGRLADRTKRHGALAAGTFAGAAVLMVPTALMALPLAALCAVLAVAGALVGAAMPARDMLVQAAAPEGASGRVFGLVTSGLNAGGILAPPLFGALIDAGQPTAIFLLAGATMLATALLAATEARRA